MSLIPSERLCSMGAFEGLRAIRRQARATPHYDFDKLEQLLRNIDADARSLDFAAASYLHEFVSREANELVPHEFYRACLAAVILDSRMTWGRSVVRGRAILMTQLSRDERQCFRSARLTDDPPSDDVVEWWDGIAIRVRHDKDEEKRDQSRKAERLSLQHERDRLAALGIPLQPRWTAIDNNGAGYDVLSYDPGPQEPINRLIEVKSTTASPLRFFISRNEWNTALRYGGTYHFHIWDMSVDPPRLYERTVSQISPHVPTDNARGKWENTVVPVTATTP